MKLSQLCKKLLEHSDHNDDFELDEQYEYEIPNFKRGIKPQKSDEQWSTASLFFLNALPFSGVNSSNLNKSMQIHPALSLLIFALIHISDPMVPQSGFTTSTLYPLHWFQFANNTTKTS